MFVDRSTVLDRAKHPNDIRPLPKRSPDRTDPLLKSGLSESDRNKRKSSRALPPEQFFADFCLSKPDEIAEYWRSGGVTGEPLFYPRTYADLPYCMLGFDRTFQCVGFEKGDICHMSLPLGVHPAGQMWARSAENLGIGAVWAGSGASTPSAVQLSLIARLKPTILLTMSSYGLHLANLAEAQGMDLRRSSIRKILSTAEPRSQAKREKLARMWGAEVLDCFGMTEGSMMGAEGPGTEGYRIWTDLFFIEVIWQRRGTRSRARSSP